MEDLQRIDDDYCIVMADVNGLKETNDTYGHEAGDILLIEAADCLKAAFEYAEAYRIGGDEFCVIVKQPVEEGMRCLERLERDSLEKDISISYGIASGHGKDRIHSVAAEADRRMYEHKRNYYLQCGKDRRKHAGIKTYEEKI